MAGNADLAGKPMTQKQSLTGAWQFRQAGAIDWLPATVPGGAHTDLLALGHIPDPFTGDNERRVAWVAEAGWEYRKQFDVGADVSAQPRVELVCDGLDTLATVTLNGHELGRTNNMFRQYRWDVKSLLHAGGNELQINFASPAKFAAQKEAERNLPRPTHSLPGGPHIRKAPCQFGWDWGPQLPPVGIWKDIRLEAFAARLADVHLRQSHADDAVTVSARVSATDWEPGLSAVLRLTGPHGATQVVRAELGAGNDETVSLQVENPQLWCPNGMGAQPLYRAEVALERETQTLDCRSYQLGLRTIELRQAPDEWGRSFEFVVNGRALSSRRAPTGSRPIPSPRASLTPYLEMLIRSAPTHTRTCCACGAAALYEEERFYDLCDRYGILVWQEFIFSCSIYPLDDPAFVENVRVEAVENVRRCATARRWPVVRQQRDGVGLGGLGLEQARADRLAEGRLRPLLPSHAARMVAAEDPDTATGPARRLVRIVRHPFREPERPDAGRCALLGRLARAQAVHRVPQTSTRAS
jgi:beta-mannosidase